MNTKAKQWYLVSIVFLGVGFVIFIYGAIDNKNNLIMNCGTFIFSSGLAGLGLCFAFDSSNKMKSIANVQFLQTVNMLEDARAYFIGGIYKPDLFGWKTQNIIEMAVELLKRDVKKRFIEPDYQDKLFHYFNISFKHLFKYPNWEKEKEAITRFITSYAMLEDYYNSLRKKELKKFITEEPKIDYDEFYSRVGEIKGTKRYGIL